MSKTNHPVWLITGCSTGFGRELALRIVQRGWKLVVTARNLEQVSEIAEMDKENVLALTLDVTKPAQIDAAVKAAMEKFGRIDVLVNNAGYGYQSSIEEGDEAEIRAQFDTNVFGLFALTRAVLPVMRAQKSGHILNITSMAGLIGFPGSGYYAASKHAVEGWSDTLRAEVGPLGIQVTCVEPGPFRTDWAGRSLKQTPSKIADYAETVGARLAGTKARSGNQAGDPVRASDIMIELTQKPQAPRHIVLGAWGFDEVTRMLQVRLEEISGQKDLSLSADYPTG
ncbi:oxidoreductase [Acidocella aminolytica]|uniref:Oxidoreductase/short-chain dehydrogenase/reductase SDR n=1 Tax=Acidocella aminolytica 101 = DSM 11237 TaxID=1120923 RepID=A0A0D6PKS2_9PROT|nr:oxidoreductase [Acidocella aminolytica]GAN81344.1 oxidoreductase/short-chain dehydrogenase/reductase SDR [Acidocella aminolytica 101 = DSM 11237]SHF42636.1 NADP-dependent 3-hydroxy acid dehydrogenase YdfG [Acidocella aminolytica 101 = DSM 11237]